MLRPLLLCEEAYNFTTRSVSTSYRVYTALPKRGSDVKSRHWHLMKELAAQYASPVEAYSSCIIKLGYPYGGFVPFNNTFLVEYTSCSTEQLTTTDSNDPTPLVCGGDEDGVEEDLTRFRHEDDYNWCLTLNSDACQKGLQACFDEVNASMFYGQPYDAVDYKDNEEEMDNAELSTDDENDPRLSEDAKLCLLADRSRGRGNVAQCLGGVMRWPHALVVDKVLVPKKTFTDMDFDDDEDVLSSDSDSDDEEEEEEHGQFVEPEPYMMQVRSMLNRPAPRHRAIPGIIDLSGVTREGLRRRRERNRNRAGGLNHQDDDFFSEADDQFFNEDEGHRSHDRPRVGRFADPFNSDDHQSAQPEPEPYLMQLQEMARRGAVDLEEEDDVYSSWEEYQSSDEKGSDDSEDDGFCRPRSGNVAMFGGGGGLGPSGDGDDSSDDGDDVAPPPPGPLVLPEGTLSHACMTSLRLTEFWGPLERLKGFCESNAALRRVDVRTCKKLRLLRRSFNDTCKLSVIDLRSCAQLKRIGDTFQNNFDLRRVHLPVVALKDVRMSFRNCPNLLDVQLKNMKELQEIYISFCCDQNFQKGSRSAPKGWVPDPRPSSVVVHNCPALRTTILPFRHQCRVTTISISGCDQLEELNGMNKIATLTTVVIGDLPSVKRIDHLCAKCPSLTSVALGHLPNLTTISGDVFAKCPNLKSLDFSAALAAKEGGKERKELDVDGVRRIEMDKRSLRDFMKGSPCRVSFNWSLLEEHLTASSVKALRSVQQSESNSKPDKKESKNKKQGF